MIKWHLVVTTVLVASAGIAVAQGQPAGVPVMGVAQDVTGGALPGATVELTALATSITQTASADASGVFRFEQVAPGTYELLARFEGLKPTRVRVRVGARPPKPVTLVLPLADFVEEITIKNETSGVRAEPGSNVDATIIDQTTLERLPVLDQNLQAMLSRFLDPGAIGTRGPQFVLDGIEIGGLNVPTSAIQQININRDPYAAEFSRPGSGRVEVITKAGAYEYHGEASGFFRDSALDASPALAAEPPPEQHRLFEGFIGGPVWRSKRTSFTLSTTNRVDDAQAIVVAYGLSGKIQENVAAPYGYHYLGGTINHQHGSNNSLSLRFWYENQHRTNWGVGGTTLPEAAASWSMTVKYLSYSHQTILTPKLVNQVRVLLGTEAQATTSVTSAPKVVVLDAFSGGGAQADQRGTQQRVTLTDTLSWSKGRHFLKGGINIPEWGWRQLDDKTNTDGTFYFSSLEDYEHQRPYSFIRQLGNGQLRFLEKVLGIFAQDEIRVSPRLSVSIGLRYDWQNYSSDSNNFAPRAAFAFAPASGGKTVIRGGAGLFYDRTGSGPIQDLLRYDGTHLQRYVVTNPSYPTVDPGQMAESPPGLVGLASDFNISSRLQYSVGIEHQLRRSTNLSVTYTGAHGFDMFRSRDINAPMPPDFQVRPDPTLGVVRQIESAGTFASQSLQVSLQGKIARANGTVRYTFGAAHNDTSGINWMPPNTYDLSGEYARADFNQRQRFDLIGTLNSGSLFNIGLALAVYSGKPYSITTGRDEFNTGRANARSPGVIRNSANGPDYADLDLHWSYDVWQRHGGTTPGPRLVSGADAFNVLNRANYSEYVGTLTSPFFRQAVSAGPPRRLQLWLRVGF